jgi:hypothetical protein
MVHHLGTVDLGFEDETFGVHQDVALSSFDLLASVVTALFSAHRRSLDRLGVHHPGTRLRIPLRANPQAFADSSVDPLPSTVDAPSSEIVVDGGPSREVVRKQTPLATTL